MFFAEPTTEETIRNHLRHAALSWLNASATIKQHIHFLKERYKKKQQKIYIYIFFLNMDEPTSRKQIKEATAVGET